ncbi:TonB-dependent receptor [Hyphobacterium sp. CCMP332]|nr:TonB-dependent receptor [Hyphobacterium sp. CCMP332]
MISKIKIIILFSIALTLNWQGAMAQRTSVSGKITSAQKGLEFVAIQILNTNHFALSDSSGQFRIDSIDPGSYTIRFKALGFKDVEMPLILDENEMMNIEMTEDRLQLNEVVISGTRYELDKRESPVIVNVLKPRTLEATQSMAISEGLNYQPGVRVETNCQNCGFTQVRLNGLDGAYSQILINNRSVYSALNGVYGLDQIPSNIVERVEIVRSGGSALYGSNAIAGTINVITREPLFNAWRIANNTAFIDGTKLDNTTNFNASLVNDELKSGITIYGMKRMREAFDANHDGFSEITNLSTNVFGSKAFYKPHENSKLSVDFSLINEKRRGGDRLDLEPHLTDITEKLQHNTAFYGLSYDHFLDKKKRQKLSSYVSGQLTKRDSYYGGLGGGRTSEDSILALNAYGNTKDAALVTGIMYKIGFANKNTLVFGSEYQYNEVKDIIPGYNRLVDQKVNTSGFYSQFEFQASANLKILSGLRYDLSKVEGQYKLQSIERSSEVDLGILSPRITLFYNLLNQLQFRAGYARGFRAPQAFNEDLHISSVAGEARFVILSDNLEKELSDAYTASLNFNSKDSRIQSQFLVEGFYTILRKPFTIINSGQRLPNGSIVEELSNGNDAIVRGVNLELNFSPHREFRFENGFTIQESSYRSSQIIYEPNNSSSDAKVSTDRFLRNPNLYGYSSINWKPVENFSTDISSNYTGEMIIPKVVSPEGKIDLIKSNPFIDSNIKFSYHFDLKNDLRLELAIGVQNIFNSYQEDFSRGPQRDSDYIYGPARPRTYFIGINLGNYH